METLIKKISERIALALLRIANPEWPGFAANRLEALLILPLVSSDEGGVVAHLEAGSHQQSQLSIPLVILCQRKKAVPR